MVRLGRGPAHQKTKVVEEMTNMDPEKAKKFLQETRENMPVKQKDIRALIQHLEELEKDREKIRIISWRGWNE